MSFSSETKNSLCAIRVRKPCCREALLYGILLLSSTYCRNEIRMVTENERTSQTLLRLLSDCVGVQGSLAITNRHTKTGEPFSSYKISLCKPKELQTVFETFGYPPEKKTAGSRYTATFENGSEKEATFRIQETRFTCPDCGRHFARGVFLSAGSIADPKSGYHLDITAGSSEISNALCTFLREQGLSPKETFRKQNSIVYFKEREAIEDFLTFIGAPQAALSVMDISIYREIRNQENRHSNCDTANISKMADTSARYRKAIAALRASGQFENLSEELKLTAKLREELPEASLQELAAAHIPPITKSGVNHRLGKILAAAGGEGV